MTPEDTETLGRVIATGIKRGLAPLEKRIAALEARPAGLKYCGTWNDAPQFNYADVVTHDGSMWFANCSTPTRPGTNGDWTLCVKRGRDGRDR